MTSIKHTLDSATKALTSSSPTPRLDAELLLAKTLDVTRTFFYTHPEQALTSPQQEQFQNLLSKRLQGTPIAYLTGIREFWSLPLQVNEDTLIPRPETELLVEIALNQLKTIEHAHLLDLGTGSGAIALAIASEHPNWKILACDKNPGAVETAQQNAVQLKINNIQIIQSDWFASIPTQKFHAIVSNPPYIAEQDPHLAQGGVRFEPRQALVSGERGLDDLAYIIEQSQKWLLPGGLLLLEHGFDQGPAVTALLKQFGYQDIQCWQDWQGHDRISGGLL